MKKRDNEMGEVPDDEAEEGEGGPAMKHPGFKAVQSKIAAKEGVSKKAAGAMLAASTRKASARAVKANPHLKRVLG